MDVFEGDGCLEGDETYNGLLVTKMHLEREDKGEGEGLIVTLD